MDSYMQLFYTSIRQMEKLILIPPGPFILIANEQNSSYILHVVKGFGQFLIETLKKKPQTFSWSF